MADPQEMSDILLTQYDLTEPSLSFVSDVQVKIRTQQDLTEKELDQLWTIYDHNVNDR